MLTKTKYIVASIDKTTGIVTPVGTGNPINPTEYATQALAQAAATPLARDNPTKKYAVLLATKVATSATAFE